MKIDSTGIEACEGALNLLVNCVGAQRGDRLLLVEEEPQACFYCPHLATYLESQAQALDLKVSRITAEHITDLTDFPTKVIEMMGHSDHTIFLNRIGDYSRFLALPGACSKTICYALDSASLASPFATVSHHLMSQLLARIEDEMQRAKAWRITCPLGTDISGTFCWPSAKGGRDDDFTLSLFPVTTFKPVPCDTANGSVKISRWLMPGGAAKVEPATLSFDGVVSVAVSNGMIDSVDGPPASVRAVTAHYDTVASALGVRRDRVHSWHTGVNPRTAFSGPIDGDIERWGAISFASPRYLHFHTCGDVPPGEIAWSLFNPSVWIDDQLYWDRGRFVWLERQDNRSLIARYPGADCVLEESADIGI